MGAREGERSGLLWLLLFGGLLALLFLGLGVTVGFGSPRIPPGAIVVVEEAPTGTGVISKTDLDQALLQSAALAGRQKPLAPGEEGYEQAKDEALGGLITAVWLQGEGEAMGIVVTDAAVAKELRAGGEARSLRKAGFTRQTMYERVRGQILVQEIEERLEGEADRPSVAEARAYYEEEPPSEGESPKRESFREAKAEALAALQQIRSQDVFTEFDQAFPETWHPRTHCAQGFVVENCAEYPAFAHAAIGACYQADPEKPPKACPAPVPQRYTAQPGSITPFKTAGEPLLQRPYPEVVEGEASVG